MRLVVDLAAVINAGAIVLGLLWRRRRRARRLSHFEYVEQKEREIEELDGLQERIDKRGSGKLRS